MFDKPILISSKPNIYKFNDFYYIPYRGIIVDGNIDVNDIENLRNQYMHDKEVNTRMVDINKMYPTAIGVNLTNACNLRCIYCFSSTCDEKTETLSDEVIDNIVLMLIRNAKIRKMASLNKRTPSISLVLSGGGEPTFFVEKFKRIIKKTKKYDDIKIHLVTNGIFSVETAKYIIRNVDSINFSFDGIPLLQNKQRPTASGADSFDIIHRNIKLFDEYNKPYSIRTTVSEENYIYLMEMCEFVFTNYKGVTSWLIESVFEGGRANNLCVNQGANFSKYFDSICDYVYENYPDKMIFNTEFSYMIKDDFCSASNGSNFWVDANGDIVECNSVDRKDIFKIGTIDKSEIKITGSKDPAFINYKERMLKMCSECFAFKICAGGCPEKMLRDENGEFIYKDKSIKCDYIKSYWKNKLMSLYKNKVTSDIRLKLIEKVNNINLYQIVLRGEK